MTTKTAKPRRRSPKKTAAPTSTPSEQSLPKSKAAGQVWRPESQTETPPSPAPSQELPAAAPSLGDNSSALLDQYLEMYAAKKALEAKMDELKAELIPMVTEVGGAANGALGVITVTAMPGRKTFDQKAAKAAGVDVSAFQKVGRPYSRLDVTLDDGDD